MNALVYTSLFPNHLQPNKGIFIKQRMFEYARLAGCSIRVIAPVPYCPSWRFLGHWYTYSKIKPHETSDGIDIFHPRFLLVPKISMLCHGLSMYLSSIGILKKIHSERAFEIIDSHCIYPDGFAAVLLGRYFRKPVVLSARGSDINQYMEFKTIKPMLRYALKNADRVISVSSALKEKMLALGIHGEKISVIPNGINLERFKAEDRSIARDKLGLKRNAKILLSVGWLIPQKGIQVTLEALPRVCPYHPELEFYIIGEGLYRKELEKRIAELHLNGKVFIVGEMPNSELPTWYSAADVVCLASSREGWANVIMESLGCGTPVVATNVGGAPEIITSESIGFLADPSPEGIAKSLIDAFSKSWDRETIRSHVEGRTWQNVALTVMDVFFSISGKSSRLS